MKTAHDILREARELISEPERHCQRYYAADSEGNAVDPLDSTACCWCARGAIIRCGAGNPLVDTALSLITKSSQKLYGHYATFINDSPRGHQRILAALDLAVTL